VFGSLESAVPAAEPPRVSHHRPRLSATVPNTVIRSVPVSQTNYMLGVPRQFGKGSLRLVTPMLGLPLPPSYALKHPVGKITKCAPEPN
jgi:hypothetical protein